MTRQYPVFVTAVPLLIASVMAIAMPAAAQTMVYYEPHSGYTESFDKALPGRFAATPVVHDRVGSSARGGNLTWNITYNDVVNNTGNGFDHVTLGATRRATAAAVLDYVNTVLNATSGGSISVRFENSQTDGSGALASAGTFFFNGTGFSSGIAFQHISTGVDPDGGVPDIICTVDFGYNWNNGLGDPSGAQFDLFTVLLHEMTHGLGFLNGSSSSGSSNLGGRYGVLAQFTHNDDAGTIGTGATTARWVAPGNFTGPVGDLTGGRLVFTGTNAAASYGSNPTIYSQSPFSSGSSLSHWGDDHAGNAVMPRFVTNGLKFREYASFEIGALQDLGYTNASGTTPQGPPDTDQDLLTDDDEINIHGTDPFDPDTDGDGVRDGIEIFFGTDPLDDLDFPLLPLHTATLLAVVIALYTAGALTLRRRGRSSRARN